MRPDQSFRLFVAKLIELEEVWNQHRAIMLKHPCCLEFSHAMQARLASATNRSEFFTAIPRILDTARLAGGLCELVENEIPQQLAMSKSVAAVVESKTNENKNLSQNQGSEGVNNARQKSKRYYKR